jgi:hypothetical protein
MDMKRSILLTFAASLVLGAATAQSRMGIQIGGLLSGNSIGTYSEGGVEYSPATLAGASLGLRFSTSLGERSDLRLDFLHTGKGYRETGGTGSDQEKYTYRLVQQELPVSILFKPVRSVPGLYLGGGPYVGLNIRAKSKDDLTGIESEYSFGQDVKRAEVGFQLLAGIPVGNRMSIDLRYARAMTDTYIGYGSNRSYLFGLYVGYWLGGK